MENDRQPNSAMPDEVKANRPPDTNNSVDDSATRSSGSIVEGDWPHEDSVDPSEGFPYVNEVDRLSRRQFLKDVYNEDNGSMLLFEIKRQFQYSPWPLRFQPLRDLQLAYEDSKNVLLLEGQYLHGTPSDPSLFNFRHQEEMAQLFSLIDEHAHPLDGYNSEDDEQMEIDVTVREGIEHPQVWTPHETYIPGILASIDIDTLYDMRWSRHFDSRHMTEMPLETIICLFNYCSDFRKNNLNGRLFPGHEVEGPRTMWVKCFRDEMMMLRPDDHKETENAMQLGISSVEVEHTRPCELSSLHSSDDQSTTTLPRSEQSTSRPLYEQERSRPQDEQLTSRPLDKQPSSLPRQRKLQIPRIVRYEMHDDDEFVTGLQQYPYGYKFVSMAVAEDEIENLVFTDKYEFLRTIDMETVRQMRLKCHYPNLELTDLGPLTLLHLYKNHIKLSPKFGPAFRRAWTFELNTLNKDDPEFKRFSIFTGLDFNPPCCDNPDQAENAVELVKYLSLHDCDSLTRIRNQLTNVSFLYKLDKQLLIDALNATKRISIAKVNTTSYAELDYYSMYANEVKLAASHDDMIDLCREAAFALAEGRIRFLKHVSLSNYLVVYRIRFALRGVPQSMTDISPEQLWNAWYDSKVMLKLASPLYCDDTFFNDKDWKQEFDDEVDKMGLNLAIGYNNDSLIGILKNLGIVTFLLVMPYKVLERMVAASHALYHTSLKNSILSEEQLLFLYDKARDNSFWPPLPPVDLATLQLQYEELRSYIKQRNHRRLVVASLSHANKSIFKSRKPQDFKESPYGSVDNTTYGFTNKSEEHSWFSFVDSYGQLNCLASLDYVVLRRIRILANYTGYADLLLKEMSKADLAVLVEECNVDNYFVHFEESVVWRPEHDQEIEDLYDYGNCSKTTNIIVDTSGFQSIKEMINCENEMRPMVKYLAIQHRRIFGLNNPRIEQLPKAEKDVLEAQRLADLKNYLLSNLWVFLPSAHQKDTSLADEWANIFVGWTTAIYKKEEERRRAYGAKDWKDDMMYDWPLFVAERELPAFLALEQQERLLAVDRNEKITNFVPRLNVYELEILLTLGNLTLDVACEKFLARHYSLINPDTVDVLNEITQLSPAVLGIITWFLSVNKRLNCKINTRSKLNGKEQTHLPFSIRPCHWCFFVGVHFTNECIYKYTEEMRRQSAKDNQTCLKCGYWEDKCNATFPECQVAKQFAEYQQTLVPGKVGKPNPIWCRSCMTNDHNSDICLDPKQWAKHHKVFKAVRMIVKATLRSISVEDWMTLYKRVVLYYKTHDTARLAYGYKLMDAYEFVSRPRYRAERKPHNPKKKNHSDAEELADRFSKLMK